MTLSAFQSRLVLAIVGLALGLAIAGCAEATPATTTTSIAPTTTVDEGGWTDQAFNGVVAYCQTEGNFESCGTAVINLRDDFGCEVETVYNLIDRVKDLTGNRWDRELEDALEEYESDGSCGNDYGAAATTEAAADGSNQATMTAAEVEAFVKRLQELPGQWNDNQLRWVAALTDDSVSYEEFVTVQQEVAVDQASLVAQFGLFANNQPAGVSDALDALVDHYEGRLELLRDDVFPAAVSGDDSQLQGALSRYATFTDVSEIEPILLGVFSVDPIRQHLETEGISPEQLVDAIVSAAGS